MKLTIETDHEEDGRWIAEVPGLPAVLCYGSTQREAMAKAGDMKTAPQYAKVYEAKLIAPFEDRIDEQR